VHPAVAGANGHAPDRDHRSVFEHLDRWESERLLTHAEAEAIRAFEVAEAGPERRIPLVAEVLGYVGAALVVAAGAVLFGERWTDLSRTVQLLCLGGLTLLFLAPGWPLRRHAEPALRRLSGVLWTVSTCALAGFLAVLLVDRPSGSDVPTWAPFAVAFGTAVYARLLLVAVGVSTSLQLALFGATLGAMAGAGAWAVEGGWGWLENNGDLMFATGLLVLAVSWLVAGRAGVLAPELTADVIGTVGGFIAPLIVMGRWEGVATLLGVVVAAGLLATSVWLRSVAMLALAGIGLFAYLTAAIVYYLADSVGLPIALFASGVALVAVAVMVARLKTFTAEGTPATDRSHDLPRLARPR
jgi:hypothetical protein